jgi:phosphocarrier protein FPr
LDVFHTQIRALLRAGVGHQLKIMFPMIGTLQEVQDVITQVTEVKSQLTRSGLEFDPDTEIGIMVEVPSAAIMAADLIKYLDFFSIGTNDLTQYTLAADRTNSFVAEYADALDPAVLRLIDMVIKAAHQAGKWVGLCGELAGDPAAVPVLLGMHLDEFSMNARAIPFIKEKIRRFTLKETEAVMSHALSLSSARQVREYLTSLIPKEEQ